MTNDNKEINECKDNIYEKEIKIIKRKEKMPILKKSYFEEDNILEIGVDEVGRGPLFGRVYTAAVILPKDGTFDCSMVKDSKKFHSKKKIMEAAKYIKENAISWSIQYEDEKIIDEINILQATQQAMHSAINDIFLKNSNLLYLKNNNSSFHLLIDGNYFKPFSYFNKVNKKLELIPYTTVEGGDNKYASIAAASILAKVERDEYIENLCLENPYLIENYSIDSNKGYGSKKHLDGIKAHGITEWHRKSFGICKNY